jgi:hypothetical protein
MIDFVVTFLSLFFIDIFYTYYLRAVSEGKVLLASSWAVIVTILGAFVVINYTTNHMLLIPAALGSFCGTWVGMKLRARM